MTWRSGTQAAAALTVADRLLAGATGQAMSDAALRSAAGQPALAELLRREQDARLLARGLLEELRDADGADAPRRTDDETQALRQRLGEAETELQRVRDELRQQHPEFDRLLRPQPARPADVARHLAADEALLLALPTDRALYLWAVRPGAPVAFARAELGRDALQQRVQRLREGLDLGATGGRTPRFDRALAHELYQAVLGPVAGTLAGVQHLIVATGGPLASLPFAALAARAEGPDAWVAQTWALSQVPSVAAWLALRQLPPARPAPEPLIAWADPAYAPAGGSDARTTPARSPAGGAPASLPPLPETRDEAQAIARALKANPERDLLLGPRATRDSVLAASRSGALARKRVVVFATHGLSPGDLPGLQQPALALAAAGADPLGSLMGLDDILGLKLNADWVVLSACNTAGGDGRRSESLTGLARGFLHAGSRSLLVTHWAVESDSARMLTTATFEHQAAHPRASKADSLRQAMLGVMAQPKYAHPAFWAPFALVGDGAR
jgi:CHAT domain-containing protein